MRFLQRLLSVVILPCAVLSALALPARADVVTISIDFLAAGVNSTQLEPANVSASFTTEALDACLASGGCTDGGNLFFEPNYLNGLNSTSYYFGVVGTEITFLAPGDHIAFHVTDPNDRDILDFHHPVSFTGAFSAYPLIGDCERDDPTDINCLRTPLSAVSPTATTEIRISSEVTPEPASWVMLCTGVAGGAGALRRRLFSR